MKLRSRFTGSHPEKPHWVYPSTALWAMIAAAALMFVYPFSRTAIAQDNKQTVEHEAGFYYTVKKGDTLWDLSKRFADTPWIWPELWKENDQIPNPHQIYPGERIRLYHRDWIERVAKQQPAPPESFTTPITTAETPKEAAAVAFPAPPMPEFLFTAIDAVGFLREKPAQPLGTIFKMQQPKAFVGSGDVVYIRTETATGFTAGQKYTIYRPLDPLADTKTKRAYGIPHLLVGTVRISDIEPRYVIGVIEKAFRAIYLGDKLMPFQARSPAITLAPAVPGLKGVFIASENQNAIIGEQMTGFIDKGRRDGVAIGQEYLLYYQESDKVNVLDKDPILLAPINFGTLLVLHTEENSATVLVTDSRDAIAPGTAFRAPGQ